MSRVNGYLLLTTIINEGMSMEVRGHLTLPTPHPTPPPPPQPGPLPPDISEVGLHKDLGKIMQSEGLFDQSFVSCVLFEFRT